MHGTMHEAIIDNDELDLTMTVHLEFTNQNNVEKGESISHGNTNEELVSPLKAVQ
jgi:hypothetical protein